MIAAERDAFVWDAYTRTSAPVRAIAADAGYATPRSVRIALAREAARRGVPVPRRRSAEWTAPKPDRDAAMLRARRAGASLSELAREHGVTVAGARFAVMRQAAREAEAAR